MTSRILIAGTQSGVGKTSLTLALVSAFKRRGMRVQTFKVGPDFLDPSYLTIASGRPCYNLDTWMMGQDYVRELFARAAGDADVAVIEGVMGLYDGASTDQLEGSTAEAAILLEVPVLLTANVHGMARSLAAMVKGYAELEPRLTIAGVLANHAGSERHAQGLAESLRAANLPPLVGAIPRGALPSLPSRHLGLVTADPETLSPQLLNALADGLEKHAKVDEILKLAHAVSRPAVPRREGEAPSEPRRGTARTEPRPPNRNPIRVGVARDDAFHFYYADNLDALAQAGAELAWFSPMRDARLPSNLQALYFGGGYPEEHAETLAANRPLLDEIRQFAASGHPIYAECGGLMYLSRNIETLDQRRHAMVGLLPTECRMLERRRMLGYAEITLRQDSLWGAAGSKLRGHEFHYSEITATDEPSAGWQPAYDVCHPRTPGPVSEGFQRERVVASYVHLHLASRPGAIQYFAKECSR